MFALSPRSTIPIRGPPVAPGRAGYSVTAGGETCPTKSWSSQRGTARRGRSRGLSSRLARRRHDPAQAAVGPQVPRECAGVDAGDRRDAVVAQECGELAGAIEHGRRGIGHDKRPQPRPERLVLVEQPPVVADQRIGHDHDLAGIRGVRADLLVAGLARVDDEVAAGRDGRAERHAGEHGAVLECQQRRSEVADPRVDDGRGPRRGWGDHAGNARPGTRSVGRAAPWARARRNAPPIGRGTVDQPPSRPHGTGTPASQDRP